MAVSTVTLKAPDSWPFGAPVVPPRVVPSKTGYKPDGDGLIQAEFVDVGTLLGFGFYFYGTSSGALASLSDVADDVPAEDDVLTFKTGKYRPRPPSGGSCSCLVLISSADVTDPENFYDTTIPADQPGLIFRASGLKFSATDAPCVAFSFDNGATFLCDVSNADSYARNGYYRPINNAGLQFSGLGDSLLVLGGYHDSAAPFTISLEIDIEPGSATEYCQIEARASIYGYGPSGGFTPYSVISRFWGAVNPVATVTPTPARLTTLRLLAYDDGDANRVTSSTKIVAGKFTLSER